jgi:glycosyltransferase involved in cell wall biosynthesis
MFLVNSLLVGGSERKTIRLANALAADNGQVMLAYLNPPETLMPQVHPGVAVLNLRRRGKFSVEALRRLAAAVRKSNSKTLVAVNLYPALYAILVKLLCRDTRLRVAVSVNTTEFATAKERMQMLLYRYILRRADLVIFGADRQRQLWSARYGLDRARIRTTVLYNGVDTSSFSIAKISSANVSDTPGRVILGTVGAFRVEKAQKDLVRAVHELTARGLDVGAIIVGDGPERQEIEREIRRLGVECRVRLVGEALDVRPYLAAMDVFVLSSVAVETFSNAALEAMAMSRPIVATSVGGMDEMLQFGGGMMYPPGDVKALCDALMPLLESARVRRELGEQARRAVEAHFSFDRMSSDFRERVLNVD